MCDTISTPNILVMDDSKRIDSQLNSINTESVINQGEHISSHSPESISDEEMVEDDYEIDTRPNLTQNMNSHAPTRLEEIVRSLQSHGKQKQTNIEPETKLSAADLNNTKEGVTKSVEEACETCSSEIAPIKRDLTYLTHQVYRLMLALRVPTCTCSLCSERHREHSAIFASAEADSKSHTKCLKLNQSPLSLGLSCSSKSPNLANNISTNVGESEVNGGAVSMENDWERETKGSPPMTMQDIRTQIETSETRPQSDDLKRGMNANGGIPWGYVGRCHKYSTPAEKKAVANYAATFGATAAARKFNISPAVASYYHRKVYNRPLPKGRRPRFMSDDVTSGPPTPTHPQMASGFSTNSEQSNEIDDEAIDESVNGDYSNGEEQQQNSAQLPATNIYELIKNEITNRQNVSVNQAAPEELNKLAQAFSASNGQLNNAAMLAQMLASAGRGASPLLRRSPDLSSVGGRGRGRPKLIGDELDARLMDHLIKERRSLGRRFNVQQVLQMATDFVRRESPGLLQEEGGPVELKQTWAMKVLNRVNQAERANIMHNSVHNSPRQSPFFMPMPVGQ